MPGFDLSDESRRATSRCYTAVSQGSPTCHALRPSPSYNQSKGCLVPRRSTTMPGSITHWMARLQAGDVAGAGPLWEHYFDRLVALARERLRGARRRDADEEDVASFGLIVRRG